QGIKIKAVSTLRDQKFYRIFSLLHRFLNKRLPFFASKAYYGKYFTQIARDLQKQRCDIVHIPNFSQFVPIIRKYNPDIKIVLHMHCEWLTQLNAQVIRNRLRQVDLIVGCSEYISTKIRNRFHEYAAKCVTVHNGVTIEGTGETFNKKGIAKNGTVQLLFVGRLTPEKGVHVLIDACEILSKKQVDLQCNIIGPEAVTPKEFIVNFNHNNSVADLDSYYEKSYLSILKERVETRHVQGVNFVGLVPHQQIRPYYEKADVLVNPSFSESFGMSLVEAMASSVPVVATQVGGMTEIVDDEITGKTVKPGDADELAGAIYAIASDKKKALEMGKAGREKAVKLFSWDVIAGKLYQYYNGILAAHV
ncbi:MAG: glycosyltransferase, partial [Actinobacteria bacterium]|nr:glycosyltransferase [Actinomycetota bacterium]